MGPPYRNHYSYFRADANEFIRQNRAWTVDERNWTISTIWAGDRNVVNHYATRTRNTRGKWLGTSPGLPTPNPIPAVPFATADVDHAKNTHTMPVLAAVPGPAPAVHPPPVAAVPAAAPAYVSSQLHDFWPRLPWAPEPDLAPFDLDKMKDEKSKFIQDGWLDTEPHMPPPSDGSHWHGIKLLATGSYGAAGLWVEADATNNICDRMVIKEAKTFTKSEWRDPKNWRDRLPREIRIHELLEERRAVDPSMCRHIVRFRAHQLLMISRRYRLYLDYHAGGDLNGAMKQCADNWKAGRDSANEDIYIPEGFVWYIIKALATACLVLQNGTTSDTPVNDWRSITHLDLRLPNVLLDVYTQPTQKEKAKSVAIASSCARDDVEDTDGADAHRAKEPPVVPILADFGVSFFSPKSDGCPISDNPDQYIIGVDPRYPPEMHQQAPPYDILLGEKTDVWGIGSIAWSLITNKQDDEGPFRCDRQTYDIRFEDWAGRIPLAIELDRNYTPQDDSNVLMRNSQPNPAADEYGPEIKELVRRCLNYIQDDRPTLREIIAEADRVLSGPDYTTFTDQIMDKDALRLTLPDFPEFAIGMPVDEAKRRARTDVDHEILP